MGDDKKFNCDYCQKTYVTKHGLKIHEDSIHRNRKYVCELCKSEFCSKCNLNRHIKRCHLPQPTQKCAICGQQVNTRKMKKHLKICAVESSDDEAEGEVKEKDKDSKDEAVQTVESQVVEGNMVPAPYHYFAAPSSGHYLLPPNGYYAPIYYPPYPVLPAVPVLPTLPEPENSFLELLSPDEPPPSDSKARDAEEVIYPRSRQGSHEDDLDLTGLW